jgi:hypothetical protein
VLKTPVWVMHGTGRSFSVFFKQAACKERPRFSFARAFFFLPHIDLSKAV